MIQRRVQILTVVAAVLALGWSGCASTTSATPPTPYVPPAPPLGIVSSPSSVALTSAPSSQAISVSEAGYDGVFNAALTCTPTAQGSRIVASVSPASAKPGSTGQPVAFSVATGLLSGSCTLTVADANGKSIAVPVSASIGAISPLMLSTTTLTLTGITSDATFSAQEPGYGGMLSQFFSATAACSPVDAALVTSSAFSSAAGAPAVFNVNAQSAGTCTVTVGDQVGQSATITVVIAPT